MAAIKSAFVTGASSGIGRAAATLLTSAGYRVFAGVRKESDADVLRQQFGENVVPVIVDVTQADTIARAVALIGERVGVAGLQGLVNNAGAGLASPLEALPLDKLRALFEVNVFGVVAVTQASLNLLRRGHGRIVNISSVGAHIALPFISPLAASKAAVGSLNDALRLELRRFGIAVVAIEPGAIRTKAVDTMEQSIEPTLASFTAEQTVWYADDFRQAIARGLEHERKGSDPDVVAHAILRALTVRRPKTRYPVGASSAVLTLLPRILPDALLDPLRCGIMGIDRNQHFCRPTPLPSQGR
jgi:NAD(P)-dependent dehydrogenase (short-subunit alcohol dehydrogenase family)